MGNAIKEWCGPRQPPLFVWQSKGLFHDWKKGERLLSAINYGISRKSIVQRIKIIFEDCIVQVCICGLMRTFDLTDEEAQDTANHPFPQPRRRVLCLFATNAGDASFVDSSDSVQLVA